MRARLIQVIETDLELRGNGTKASPYRRVVQYYSLDGQLLAEVDSVATPPDDGARPVRIGDVLTKPPSCVAVDAKDGGFGTRTFTVSKLPRRHGDDWEVHGLLVGVGGITHADGTPIRLPEDA